MSAASAQRGNKRKVPSALEVGLSLPFPVMQAIQNGIFDDLLVILRVAASFIAQETLGCILPSLVALVDTLSFS